MCQCEGTSRVVASCCLEDDPPTTATLDAKLAIFDRHADQAVDELIAWLTNHRADLVALARGRHVDGHYRYADGNFLEYDDGRLLAETAEELADAIVYHSRQVKRRLEGGR